MTTVWERGEMMFDSKPDMDNPVSVVIPAYNAAATIAETLRSVLAQTHRNLDIVVVDDGSTDGTWDVLQSFGSAIRAIRQPNSGIGIARNTGVTAARGEYIALLDADDLCEPERIAIELHYLLNHPDILLCSSDFSGFDQSGPLEASYCGIYYTRCSPAQGGARARYPEHGKLDIASCLLPPSVEPVLVPIHSGRVYEELSMGNFVHPPTVMFRREALDRAGLFDPAIKIACEWEWFVRVARVGRLGYIDRPLLRYRRSATQISSDPRTALDSLAVAYKIHAIDPGLERRAPTQTRRHLGALNLSAADAVIEVSRMRALGLLLKSLFVYRVFKARSPRVLFKIVLPRTFLSKLRRLRTSSA
ncbi:putative glycosyltransferase EpsH [mine drainage metagenome]|uniref:Putative glycosyltransferase EpsH n=1 Tax=mine drainage metagenome TaxID=410659 RepID=A0A1J5R088_9ZZZZ